MNEIPPEVEEDAIVVGLVEDLLRITGALVVVKLLLFLKKERGSHHALIHPPTHHQKL